MDVYGKIEKVAYEMGYLLLQRAFIESLDDSNIIIFSHTNKYLTPNRLSYY